jgi:hypothetical protein
MERPMNPRSTSGSGCRLGGAVLVLYAKFALGRSFLSFEDRPELALRHQAAGTLTMRGAECAVKLVFGVAEGALNPVFCFLVFLLS